MTEEQIDSILQRVRTWPQDRREDAIRILLAMEAQDLAPYVLSDEERADIQEALAEVDRNEVAADTEVTAIFDRYRG